ncbi:MAG: hypothetical protein RBQ94_04315 [Methanimicrococcus sp.]|nr:hypothetical protein [Methanimicrococcus sp.]
MNSIDSLISNLDQKTKTTWALDCAEHVLPLFEELYPDDSRLREAVFVGRAWVLGNAGFSEIQKATVAAHNVARDIILTDFSSRGWDPVSEGSGLEGAACAVARAVGQAVAAADKEAHTLSAASYAVKAVFFKTESDAAVKEEREWQRNQLKKYV